MTPYPRTPVQGPSLLAFRLGPVPVPFDSPSTQKPGGGSQLACGHSPLRSPSRVRPCRGSELGTPNLLAHRFSPYPMRYLVVLTGAIDPP